MQTIIITKTRILYVWTILLALSIFSIVYIFSLESSIRSVLEKTDNEEKIASLETGLSSLESEYLNSLGAITMSIAEEHGFKEAGSLTSYERKHAPSLGIARDYVR